MKEAVTIVISVGLAFLLFKLTEKDQSHALDLYQFQQEKKRIEKLEAEYLKLDQELDTLQNRLNLKHEKIDSASVDELRDYFNEFRDRTKRHPMLRHR